MDIGCFDLDEHQQSSLRVINRLLVSNSVDQPVGLARINGFIERSLHVPVCRIVFVIARIGVGDAAQATGQDSIEEGANIHGIIIQPGLATQGVFAADGLETREPPSDNWQ